MQMSGPEMPPSVEEPQSEQMKAPEHAKETSKHKLEKTAAQVLSKYEKKVETSKNPQKIVDMAAKDLMDTLNKNPNLREIKDGFQQTLEGVYANFIKSPYGDKWDIKVSKNKKFKVEAIKSYNRPLDLSKTAGGYIPPP